MVVILLTFIQSLIGVAVQTLHPCATKIDEIVAGLSTNEAHQWDLKQIFSGSYLSYELLADNSSFFIQNPIHEFSNPVLLKESVSKITGIAALQESTQRVWLNHFAYLSKQTGITKLFYAESSQGSYANPPNFNQVLLISQNNSVTCPGLEYITKDTFILDCFDNSQTYLQNTFIIVQKNGTLKQYYNENYNDYITTTKRINQVVSLKYNGTQQQYLFRSTPAYATERKFDISSIIEVFKLNDTQAPQRVAILTSYNIAVLIGDPKPFAYEFSLIDFEVSHTGTLYIQTAFQGVFILTMDEQFQFTFVSQLIPSKLQAYEFDVDWILRNDGSFKEVIAILLSTKVYIYSQRVLINEYDLDLIASYPSHLSITQEFIITQIKGLTQLFNTETQDVIYKESIEGLMAFIINPFYTEMIAITQIYSRRYQITNGQLKFSKIFVPTPTKKQLIIRATDTFSNKCNISLIYKIMDSKDSSVQTLQELKLQTLEYDQPPERVFEKPVTGPNIKYQTISSTIGSLIVRQEKRVPLDSKPENEIFFQILSLYEDDSNIATIHQDTDKIVNTQVCKVSYEPEIEPFECRSYSSYKESVFLNENNFAWFNSDTAFYTVTISADQYSALVYVITVNEVQLAAELYYKKESINKINSVSILSNSIYLTQSNKKVIDVWKFGQSNIISITETMMKSLGMTGNWSPKKTYGNHQHHASLLFVVNDDNVVIIDFHSEVTLIKEIQIGKGEICVAIGKSSFVIIYKGTNTEGIEEYDLSHLGFISPIKQLPLYFYQLVSPLKFSFSLGSGSFNILAFDIKETSGFVVLGYQLSSTLRDSLYKVFPLQTNSISISATGFNQDILYIKSNTSGYYYHEVVASFHTYYYQIIPYYPSQDQIIFNNQIKIQAYNNVQRDLSPILLTTITLINTMTQLIVDDYILDQKTLKVTNRSQYEIQFDNDWISGFTGSHVLDCGQCAEKIQMLDIFNEINVWDDPTLNIIHSGPFTYTNDIQNPEYQVLLSVTTNLSCIIIVNNTGNVVKRINLKPYSNGFTYDKVANTKIQFAPQQFIFLSGFNQNDGYRYIQTIQCKTIENCGNVTFWNQLNQTRYVKEFQHYHTFLYVLEVHPTDPLAYQGQLQIYSFTVYDTSATIIWRNNFTMPGQNLVSFLISETYFSPEYYVHLLLFSFQGQFKSYTGYQTATTIYFYPTSHSLQVTSQIVNQGFAPVDKFIDLLVTKPPILILSSFWAFEINLFLTGQADPHTCLTFVFIYNNMDNVTFLNTTILFQLNSHYQAQSLLGTKKYKDSYLIPYFDGKNLIISYYKVQENKKVISSYGGLIVPNNTKNRTQIVCLLVNNNIALTNFQENNDKTYYLSTLYRLVDAFIFSVNNSAGEIYSQNITLTLKNELGQATTNIKLVSGIKQLEDNLNDQINESNTFLGKLSSFVGDLF